MARAGETSPPGLPARLLAIAGGVALGSLLGAVVSTATGRVPAEGLIGIGAFFVTAGLVISRPALWRRMHDGNVRWLRESRLGRARPDSTLGAAASLLREQRVERHERWRDSVTGRLFSASDAVAAGATMILIALLR